MKPVAAKATFCDTLNFSAGREKSLRPAATSPHLASGAQKKIVLVVSVIVMGHIGLLTLVQLGGSGMIGIWMSFELLLRLLLVPTCWLYGLDVREVGERGEFEVTMTESECLNTPLA
jgi:nucleoside permease NupC